MYETSWTNLDNGQTEVICADGNTARASRLERDEENKAEESDNDGISGQSDIFCRLSCHGQQKEPYFNQTGH